MDKPRKLSQRGLLAFALSALLIVGCGGDGDSSGTSGLADGPAPTKGAFIAAGNAICGKADARQAAAYKVYLKETGEDKSKTGEEEVVVEVGLPAIRTEIEELRQLRAPAGDEDEIAGMLDEVEAAVKESEKKPLSVYTADTPFKAPEEEAKKYGLTKCGFT
jgi:hypothetical protein